mgnify:CR=1 FL=1
METRYYLALFPVTGIAILGWLYLIFVLGRYRGMCRFKAVELFALFLYILGGFAAYIAELSVRNEKLIALQICASMYRSTVNWLGLVLIINESVICTKQQLISLFFVLIISVLWEVQHRLVLTP